MTHDVTGFDTEGRSYTVEAEQDGSSGICRNVEAVLDRATQRSTVDFAAVQSLLVLGGDAKPVPEGHEVVATKGSQVIQVKDPQGNCAAQVCFLPQGGKYACLRIMSYNKEGQPQTERWLGTLRDAWDLLARHGVTLFQMNEAFTGIAEVEVSRWDFSLCPWDTTSCALAYHGAEGSLVKIRCQVCHAVFAVNEKGDVVIRDNGNDPNKTPEQSEAEAADVWGKNLGPDPRDRT